MKKNKEITGPIVLFSRVFPIRTGSKDLAFFNVVSSSPFEGPINREGMFVSSFSLSRVLYCYCDVKQLFELRGQTINHVNGDFLGSDNKRNSDNSSYQGSEPPDGILFFFVAFLFFDFDGNRDSINNGTQRITVCLRPSSVGVTQ